MKAVNVCIAAKVVRFWSSGPGLRGSGQGVVRSGSDHFILSVISALSCKTLKWSDFWQACIGTWNADAPVYAILLRRVASLLEASEEKILSRSERCVGYRAVRRDCRMWIAALVVVIYVPVLPSFLAADIHG